MNEAKVKKLINETANTLNLTKAERKYLDVTINMVYTLGSRDGLEEGRQIMCRELTPIKQEVRI